MPAPIFSPPLAGVAPSQTASWTAFLAEVQRVLDLIDAGKADLASLTAAIASSSITLTNIGGTANAITANLPAGLGLTAVPVGMPLNLRGVGPNTGAVTLSVAGGPALPLRDGRGRDLAAGDLTGGTPLLVRPSGDGPTEYRIMSSLIHPADLASVAASALAALLAEEAARQAALQEERAARLVDVSRGGARGLAVLDERGFVGAEMGASYTLLGGIETDLTSEGILRRQTSADGIVVDEILTVRSPGIAEALVDERGFIGWGLSEDGTVIGSGGDSPVPPEPELAPVNITALRRTRTKLGLLSAGRDTQLDIGYFGDSFVDGETRFLSALTRMLVGNWGDAGGGWTGFAWGNAGTISRGNARKSVTLGEFTVSSLSQTGGWSHSNRGGGDPSLGHVETSTAGAFIDLSGPDTGQFTLFYEAGLTATIRYSWDAGASWTSLPLDTGAGPRAVDLTGAPAGVWDLRIEHVSGTARLYGLFCRTDTPGIRMSKYGNNGSHTGHWAAAVAVWDQTIAALPLNLAIITLGTNDQGSGISPTQMAENIEVMVARLRAAKPALDVLVVMPPENLGGRATPMTDYADAVGRWCRDNGVGWIDMQCFFGPDPAEYADDGPVPLWNPDKIHVGSVVSAQPGGALWAHVMSDTLFNR